MEIKKGNRVLPEDLPLDEIRRARALLLDGHDVSPAITAASAARTAGVPVVLDAEKVQEGTEERLSLCDHIVATGHFPGLLFPGISAEDGAREILAFANSAAGLSCRGMGGRAAIPTIEAIREAGGSPDRQEHGDRVVGITRSPAFP